MVNKLSIVGQKCGEPGTDRGHALEDPVTDGSGTGQGGVVHRPSSGGVDP